MLVALHSPEDEPIPLSFGVYFLKINKEQMAFGLKPIRGERKFGLESLSEKITCIADFPHTDRQLPCSDHECHLN